MCMKFILYKDILEEIVTNGYKTFEVTKRKGYSIEFSDKERNICVNTSSERTGFSVNTSRYSYPYMPTTPYFFKTQAEALSFAVILMEGVIRYNTRYLRGSQLAEVTIDFLKEDKGTLFDEDIFSLLIAKLLNKEYKKWLDNYIKTINLKF